MTNPHLLIAAELISLFHIYLSGLRLYTANNVVCTLVYNTHNWSGFIKQIVIGEMFCRAYAGRHIFSFTNICSVERGLNYLLIFIGYDFHCLDPVKNDDF